MEKNQIEKDLGIKMDIHQFEAPQLNKTRSFVILLHCSASTHSTELRRNTITALLLTQRLPNKQNNVAQNSFTKLMHSTCFSCSYHFTKSTDSLELGEGLHTVFCCSDTFQELVNISQQTRVFTRSRISEE